MKFQFNDGGRKEFGFRGNAGDCVVRAVAIATGLPYGDVYASLSEGCKGERKIKRGSAKGSARNGVRVDRKWFKDFMTSIGWKWTATMGIGTGCTVHLDAAELPAGRLIVSVSKHYTAVIDGVINDTYNPSERGTTVYSPNTPESELPKGAYRLSNGNGFAYSPKRCVYGYWSKA